MVALLLMVSGFIEANRYLGAKGANTMESLWMHCVRCIALDESSGDSDLALKPKGWTRGWAQKYWRKRDIAIPEGEF